MSHIAHTQERFVESLVPSDIKAVSLVFSVRTHHLEGNVEKPVTWFKQVYLTVVIGQGEIGEINHRLKWLHT